MISTRKRRENTKDTNELGASRLPRLGGNPLNRQTAVVRFRQVRRIDVRGNRASSKSRFLIEITRVSPDDSDSCDA